MSLTICCGCDTYYATREALKCAQEADPLACLPCDCDCHSERMQRSHESELEMTADKLSDLWIYLDNYARGGDFTREMAAELLKQQECPGWKETKV